MTLNNPAPALWPAIGSGTKTETKTAKACAAIFVTSKIKTSKKKVSAMLGRKTSHQEAIAKNSDNMRRKGVYTNVTADTYDIAL